MKKNDWILLTSVTAYSYLFYAQTAGINFLVFTAIMIALLLSRNREVYKTKSWQLAAVGSILSAICVTYYGSGISILANIISLCLLSSFSINSNTSLILSFLFSCYSVAASFVFMILDTIKRSQNKSETTINKPVSVTLMLYLVPLLIAVVFFFMYQAANPVFNNFTKKINLDFITINWFFFTLGGLFLMYGFFYHKTIKAIAYKDQTAPDLLSVESISGNGTFASFSNIDNEKLSGIILFLLLNTLLLTVNLLDINFLWFDGTLPKELSYSAFVHQGTGALITSILIAILIILFYFRGALNFHTGNKWLKLLACLWVIQNAFMILSTAYRNNLYINEYSLTYKRIGVYVWLLLVLIGLITTFIKILKAKSNWYLFRTNGWMFYIVLLASCFINWDVVVTDFNIAQAKRKDKPLDLFYLTNLSEKNIPQLLALSDSTKIGTVDEASDERNMSYTYYGKDYCTQLNYKLYSFLDEMQQHQWQSFCAEKARVYKSIEATKKDILEIDLQNYYKKSLKPLAILEYLKVLNFSNNLFEDVAELKLFPKLESLYLMSNSLDSLTNFPKMENLKTLSLANNNIMDVSALKNAPNLVSLDLSGNKLFDLKTIPSLKKLNSLSINSNGISDLSPLLSLPELNELNISGNWLNKSIKFPILPSLLRLQLQNTQLSSNDMFFFQGMRDLNNLEQLNLSDNHLTNLYGVITYTHVKKGTETDEQFVPLFDKLKSLNIARNNLSSSSPLLAYPNLEELNIDGNQLKDISKLNQLTLLKVLSMNNCEVNNLDFLKNLEHLESLDITNNPIADYTPLYGLKNLKQLTVLTASKQIVEKLKKALPNTKIIAYNYETI